MEDYTDEQLLSITQLDFESRGVYKSRRRTLKASLVLYLQNNVAGLTYAQFVRHYLKIENGI